MKFFVCWDDRENFGIGSEDTSRVLLCRGDTFGSRDLQAADLKPDSKLPRPPSSFVNAR
jgi:hypothetical protein